jgi:D-alanyl-D-alanine carboxypeptidase
MRLPLRSSLLAGAIALVAALAAGCGGSGHDAAKAPAPPTLTAQLRHVVAAGSPGVIAYVNDGHGVKLSAEGLADTGTGRVLRPTDRFRAGSNTKTMVATVALQLVGEGKLSLDDTVEHWLPGVLSYGDRVTVRQLLNMTGGVPDYVPALEHAMVAHTAVRTRPYTPRDLVAQVADKPDFEPGTAWNYSTTGYVLAGMIVERASGGRLGGELQRRIFAPMHMRDTYLPGATTAIRGAHAHGYGDVQGTLRDLTDFNASAGWAGGGAVTTASDMSRFWRGLLGGRLLAPAQLEAMKRTVAIKEGLPLEYGLGLMKFGTHCQTLWGNGGDLPGFSSEFLNTEDGKVQSGVIVNVNPIPAAVADKVLGAAKGTAIGGALHVPVC